MAETISMNSMTVEELKEAMEHPAPGERTILIDVRSPEEFAAGHVPGAVNRPVDKMAIYEDALRAYDRVFVNCFSGGRSGAVCARLEEIGLRDVRNVEGGMMLWKRAGFPVER